MDKIRDIQIGETMSALADGELRGEAFARCMDSVKDDALEAWHAYHVIGDVLRSQELAAGTPSIDFLGKLRARLEAEPRPVASPAILAAQSIVAAALPSAVPTEAANDGNFRWKMVAGVASVAAVAAIGWSVVAGGAGGGSAPAGSQLASSQPASSQLAGVPPGTVLTGTDRGVMIRDARIDEMMAAHRQLGGGSALQTPAGFLRNATFDASSR